MFDRIYSIADSFDHLNRHTVITTICLLFTEAYDLKKPIDAYDSVDPFDDYFKLKNKNVTSLSDNELEDIMQRINDSFNECDNKYTFKPDTITTFLTIFRAFKLWVYNYCEDQNYSIINYYPDEIFATNEPMLFFYKDANAMLIPYQIIADGICNVFAVDTTMSVDDFTSYLVSVFGENTLDYIVQYIIKLSAGTEFKCDIVMPFIVIMDANRFKNVDDEDEYVKLLSPPDVALVKRVFGDRVPIDEYVRCEPYDIDWINDDTEFIADTDPSRVYRSRLLLNYFILTNNQDRVQEIETTHKDYINKYMSKSIQPQGELLTHADKQTEKVLPRRKMKVSPCEYNEASRRIIENYLQMSEETCVTFADELCCEDYDKIVHRIIERLDEFDQSLIAWSFSPLHYDVLYKYMCKLRSHMYEHTTKDIAYAMYDALIDRLYAYAYMYKETHDIEYFKYMMGIGERIESHGGKEGITEETVAKIPALIEMIWNLDLEDDGYTAYKHELITTLHVFVPDTCHDIIVDIIAAVLDRNYCIYHIDADIRSRYINMLDERDIQYLEQRLHKTTLHRIMTFYTNDEDAIKHIIDLIPREHLTIKNERDYTPLQIAYNLEYHHVADYIASLVGVTL